MPIAYQDLTTSLLQYKQSSLDQRNEFLDRLIAELNALPDAPADKAEAKLIYHKLAYVSQQITYVNNLRKLENQEFIDMLADYNELGAFFTQNGYEDLNQYFEIQKFKWRLKQPIENIPQNIWDRFHEAQVAFLTSKGKQANIRPIDFSHPPHDQLYSLPQMFYNYENEAVDRIYVDSLGQFNMMVGPLGIQCPGGGMMPGGANALEKAAKLEQLLDEKRHQMLDEYLEEENANLFNTAANTYNEIEDQDHFKTTLMESFSKKEFLALPNYLEFKTGFIQILNRDAVRTNAQILAEVVAYIETYVKTGDEKEQSAQRKLINTLRATVQVETFKLHGVYEEAFQFVKAHSQLVVDVDQVNDVRRAGGHQTASTFLMDEPLENFFATKGIQGQVPGDDMTDGKYKRYTLLQLLANFDKVRFSHIMTVLAGQEAIFDRLDFAKVWHNEDYQSAKDALLKSAHAAQKSMLFSSGDLRHALNRLTPLVYSTMVLTVNELISTLDEINETGELAPGTDAYAEVMKAVYNIHFLLNGTLSLQDYKASIEVPFHSQKVNELLPNVLTKFMNNAILLGMFGEKERQSCLLSKNDYQDAYDRLKTFYDEGDDNLSAEIEQFLDAVEALKTGRPEKDRPLTEALYQTVFLLEGNKDVGEYKAFADGIQNGKSSTGLKILGGIMLGICVIAIAALITLFAAPAVALAVTAAIGASLIVTGSVTGGIAVATGVTGGVGFFASRQHGLSKAAADVYDAYVDTHAHMESPQA